MKINLKQVIKTIFALALCVGAFSSIAYAEGSKELIETAGGKGYRPYTEYFNANSAGIPRKSIFYVYAKDGETITLGTSGSKIYIKAPSSSAAFAEITADNGTANGGLISSVAQEAAGPNYGSNANDNGFKPYEYKVTQSGIYTVYFVGSDPGGSQTTVQTKVKNEWENSFDQGVAAWDISVFDSNDVYKPGRVYTKYLALTTGANSHTVGYSDISLYSKVHVLTQDGYEYLVNLNGIDPWGFILYANNRGLIDSGNNRTLYKSAVTNSGATTLENGILAPKPNLNDSGKNVTHRIFFNTPASDLPSTIPTQPEASATFKVEAITDNMHTDDGQVYEGAGFTAKVNFSKVCTFDMIIDIDGNDQYDYLAADTEGKKYKDVIIRDAASAGVNTIVWNGRDADGKIVDSSVYEKINVIIYVKSGEMHLPFIDVEYNTNGIEVSVVNAEDFVKSYETDQDNPVFGRSTLFWDNETFKTADGVEVDLKGGYSGSSYVSDMSKNRTNPVTKIDFGKESPNVLSENKTFDSYSSTGGAGAYGVAVKPATAYGNAKVLDYWTYVRGYKSDAAASANSSLYVPSDNPSDEDALVYISRKITMQQSDEVYGHANIYVYRDVDADKLHSSEDAPDFGGQTFTVFMNLNGKESDEYYTSVTTATEGLATFTVPLNKDDSGNGIDTSYILYVLVPEDYSYVYGGTEVLAYLDSENQVVGYSSDSGATVTGTKTGLTSKAVRIEGSISTNATTYKTVGLDYNSSALATATLNISTSNKTYTGNTVTYNLSVTNTGSSSLVGAGVEMALPEHHTLISATGTGEFLNNDTWNGWNIGSIAAGETVSITITVEISEGKYGSYTMTGVLSGTNISATSSKSVEYSYYSPLFNYDSARATSDTANGNVLVLGKLTDTANDNSAFVSFNNIYSVGFVCSSDLTELQKSIDDFNSSSELVFYQEVTDMYNTVYDTDNYTAENVPDKTETQVAKAEDGVYYGGTVFEGMIDDIQSTPIYIQGFTRFAENGTLIRENEIYKLTAVENTVTAEKAVVQ